MAGIPSAFFKNIEMAVNEIRRINAIREKAATDMETSLKDLGQNPTPQQLALFRQGLRIIEGNLRRTGNYDLADEVSKLVEAAKPSHPTPA